LDHRERAEGPNQLSPGQSESATRLWINRPQNFRALKGRHNCFPLPHGVNHANDHNLNIPRYVEPKNEQEVLTVDEAMKRLRASADAAFAAEGKLVGILEREGLLK